VVYETSDVIEYESSRWWRCTVGGFGRGQVSSWIRPPPVRIRMKTEEERKSILLLSRYLNRVHEEDKSSYEIQGFSLGQGVL